MQPENNPRKFFTKRNIFLISVGIIIAMLLSGAVLFIFLNSVPLSNPLEEAQNTMKTYINALSNPLEEPQNTMKTYINALNDYNATAAWDLMSPNMQASYGTIENFTDSYVNPLQQSGWHAQHLEIKNEYGTISVYTLTPFQNSWRIVADIGITENNSSSATKTYTFDLKTYVFKNFRPSGWKIDSWSTNT